MKDDYLENKENNEFPNSNFNPHIISEYKSFLNSLKTKREDLERKLKIFNQLHKIIIFYIIGGHSIIKKNIS